MPARARSKKLINLGGEVDNRLQSIVQRGGERTGLQTIVLSPIKSRKKVQNMSIDESTLPPMLKI